MGDDGAGCRPNPVPAFDFSNLSARPPGRFIAVTRRLLRGVGTVQDQIAPYAEAWRTSNAAALRSEGPLWVALGDSMSQGIGASSWQAGWLLQAAARVRKDGQPFRIVNLSISGARVRDVIDRQVPALNALGTAPDLVTVLVGANDVGTRRSRAELPGSFTRMLGLLPDGSVVATMPQPLRAARAVNELIVRASAERQMVVAETKVPPWGWRGRLAEDHFHPNDLGYAAIADTFVEAITARSNGE
jgi:lysophospholipase L1-like esterase